MTFICDDCNQQIKSLVYLHRVLETEKYLCRNCLKCEECGVFLNDEILSRHGSVHIWYTCNNHRLAAPKEIQQLEQDWSTLFNKLLCCELVSSASIERLNSIRDKIDAYWNELR